MKKIDNPYNAPFVLWRKWQYGGSANKYLASEALLICSMEPITIIHGIIDDWDFYVARDIKLAKCN